MGVISTILVTASSSSWGAFSAPLILLSAHELISVSAIYFIRRAAGGTGGGSIFEAVSASLIKFGAERAAPFQRVGVVCRVSGVGGVSLALGWLGDSFGLLSLNASVFSCAHCELRSFLDDLALFGGDEAEFGQRRASGV